jgi:hypothetical protein
MTQTHLLIRKDVTDSKGSVAKEKKNLVLSLKGLDVKMN